MPSDTCSQSRFNRAVWTESSLSAWRNFAYLAIQIATAKILIRLRIRAVWSESALGAHVQRYVEAEMLKRCILHFFRVEEDVLKTLTFYNQSQNRLPTEKGLDGYYLKLAGVRQNQENGMCAQRKLWSDWASAQSDQSAWRKLGSLVSHWSDSEDWSDWVVAQADLSLRWRSCHFTGFVMRGFIYESMTIIKPFKWDAYIFRSANSVKLFWLSSGKWLTP